MEGNATRGLEIPFYMIFPKYFSCPNFSYREYAGIILNWIFSWFWGEFDNDSVWWI